MEKKRPKTKVCSYCGKRKKIEKFTSTGRLCKSCKSEYDKKRYSENGEAAYARSIAYGKTERGRASNRRASKRYGERTNWKRAKVWYAKTRKDPKRYLQFLKRHRAYGAIQYALKTGKLIKGICEVCGSKDVHAHHDDYDKKLDVRWLCPLHHGITRRVKE